MKTYQEKLSILREWGIEDKENALFYAARNGAIAKIMLDIERFFKRGTIFASAYWRENSMSSMVCIEISLEIKYRNGDRGEYLRHCWINRSTEWPKTGAPSDCTYEFTSISGSEPGRKSKAVVEFDALVDSQEFEGLVRTSVNGANYPFEYVSYSSF